MQDDRMKQNLEKQTSRNIEFLLLPNLESNYGVEFCT